MIAYAPDAPPRNLQRLRDNGWRLLLTPKRPIPREGFRFAIDNGAWGCYRENRPFNSKGFEGLVERYGSAADFIVIPDIVGGGKDSLDFSVSWLPKLRNLKQLLLPIQDGMTAHDVGMVLRQNVRVGLFLGGTTAFKLREMYAWGMVAHAWRRWFHVGRVNSIRRVRLCAEAGADSFDGSGVCVLPHGAAFLPALNEARKQPSLLTPALMA